MNISHDIALAVAHLHRNGILHRDLSSNNILLSVSHQAKVTDFGMSRIADLEPSMSQSLRKLGYMSPEALCPHPRYSEKVDIFSVGVLLLQIATRNPNPAYSARISTMTDPNVLNPKVKSEFESRKADIDKVPLSHGLLPVILECLKDTSEERPAAPQLCYSIGEYCHLQ